MKFESSSSNVSFEGRKAMVKPRALFAYIYAWMYECVCDSVCIYVGQIEERKGEVLPSFLLSLPLSASLSIFEQYVCAQCLRVVINAVYECVNVSFT